MDKFVRFEMGDRVVCTKEYKTLKVGSHYAIKGCGPLEFNADTEVNGKTGYGFCVEDHQYGYYSGRKDWWNLPYSEKIKWYYFTEKEMSDFFISEQEDYKAYQRDEKINQLLNEL
jgi:hypothetical protein